MSHLLATHAQYGGYGTSMFAPTVSLKTGEDECRCLPRAFTGSMCLGLCNGIRSEQFLSDGLRSSWNADCHARRRLRGTYGYVYATVCPFHVLAPSKFHRSKYLPISWAIRNLLLSSTNKKSVLFCVIRPRPVRTRTTIVRINPIVIIVDTGMRPITIIIVNLRQDIVRNHGNIAVNEAKGELSSPFLTIITNLFSSFVLSLFYTPSLSFDGRFLSSLCIKEQNTCFSGISFLFFLLLRCLEQSRSKRELSVCLFVFVTLCLMCSLLHIQFLLWYILKKPNKTSVDHFCFFFFAAKRFDENINMPISEKDRSRVPSFYFLVLMDLGNGRRVGWNNWFLGTGLSIGAGRAQAFSSTVNVSSRLVCADDRLITRKTNTLPTARMPSNPKLRTRSELRWMCCLLVGTIRRGRRRRQWMSRRSFGQ